MRMPLSSKAKQVNGIESINVFIAYRQGQGDDRAAQLHVLLNKTTIEIEDGKQAQLSVYWDRAAPTIDDFRRVWKGHLRTARAFILVCSPGTRQRRDKGQDWLFDEIEWWAANRRTGPILIDAMGGGEADVPAVILRKWPFAQRALLGDDDALRERIVQGIVLSERGVRYQELVRLRRLSLTLLGLLIVAVSLGFATFEFSRQAQQRAVRAESNLLVAESRGVKETDPTLAYLIAEEAFRHDPDNEQAYRNLLAAYYDADAFYTILTRDPNPPFGTTRPIYSFSEFLSKKSLLVASLYRPGELRIFSLDGTLEKTWALDHEADFAEISPDGKHVLTSRDFSRQVHLLDSQGQYIRSFNFADAVESVRFSPDGKSILVGAGNNAYLWDLNNDTASVVFKGHTNHLNDVEFSSDGRFVLTAGDKTARIWDRDGGMLRVLEHPDYVTSVAMYVGETTTRIATTCWDQLVRLWFENGELIKTYSGHDSRVYSATFSPDGKYLASASWDGTIRIWHGTSNLATDEIRVLRGHRSGVERVRFLGNGDWIATSGSDATLRLWNIKATKTISRQLTLRDNEPFRSDTSDPYQLRGTYREIQMLVASGDLFFSLRIPFEDRIFQAMYSTDKRYIWVRMHGSAFPVDGYEIMRLMNRERLFGMLPTRDEIESVGDQE